MSAPEIIHHGNTGLPPPDLALVNEQWSRRLYFPASPTGKPIEFYGHDKDGDYVLRVGGVNKLSPHEKGPDVCPSFGVRHAVLLLAMLALRHERDLGSDWVKPGFNRLWETYAGYPASKAGSKNTRALLAILRDIDLCRYHLIRTGAPVRSFNLVEIEAEHVYRNGIVQEKNLLGSRFSYRFHPIFEQTAIYLEPARNLRLDVLRSIQSLHAQSLYLWLPAFASHHDNERNPFRIGTKLVIERLGKVLNFRSKRREFLTDTRRGRTSILQSLDGLPMLQDNVRFRVALVKGQDDDFLHAWCEPTKDSVSVSGPTVRTDSMLAEAYLSGGGKMERFLELVKAARALSSDDLEMLALAKVQISESRKFLEMAKSVMLTRSWLAVLAEAKVFGEGFEKVLKSTGSRLRTAILEAMRAGAIVK